MKLVVLSEVCEIVNGGTPKIGVEDYWDGDILWITPKDLGKEINKSTEYTERMLTQAGIDNSSAKVIPANSVVLSTRAPIGYLVINSKPMSFNQGCKGLVPKSDLDVNYLYYFLRHSKQRLNDLGTGTTFPELSNKALSNVTLPLPPIERQRLIVAKLDAAFEKIDRAIELIDNNISNANSFYISTRRQEYKKCEIYDNKSIIDIGKNLDSKRRPITKGVREQGQYPYYGASGIVDYVKDYIFDDALLLISEDGANLVARSTPIAFTAVGKFWVNNHAHIFKFDNPVTHKYIEYFFENIDLKPFITGAAQPKLNQSNLNKISIPLPPENIQNSVVKKIQSSKDAADLLNRQFSKKKAALIGLKQSMLNEVFLESDVK